MLAIYCIVLFLLTSISVSCIEMNCEGDDCSIKVNKGLKVLTTLLKGTQKMWNFFKVPWDYIGKKRLVMKEAFKAFYIKASERDVSVSCKNGKSLRAGVAPLSAKFLKEQNISDLITVSGYKNETHTVTTADGYVLTLIRILPSQPSSKRRKKTALLHHDLLGSSDDWLVLGPRFALPYILSDNGYDVWLENARGNRYSRAHVKKTVDSKEFWDFTWHEIGKFDLPAVIEYVSNYEKQSVLIDYIGYGMGCTALIVLLSTFPKYNTYLNSATLLGPLVYMIETKGPLRYLAEHEVQNKDVILSLREEFKFMPLLDRFPHPLIEKFCEMKTRYCSNPWVMIADGEKGISNANISVFSDRYVHTGTSSKTILHYCQIIRSGSFRMFDYGSAGNKQVYGLSEPLAYDLSSVQISVTVFSSNDDTLATVWDASRLVKNLPIMVTHRIISDRGFTHTSFVWNAEAPTLVYNEILRILDNLP